ncbi:TetR/AcrR family transcriptional regulator [Mycetocola tolaasinivorans]|uniref:TetR/AcrR family transcriptional regulator n=1 Tax=Mycetocola tolaasinivorans TaxID=76635 RepID=UPI001C7DA88C|nr:TetR/AcrR family transcriptional regulator [Mycetocola tolaasinivorans]
MTSEQNPQDHTPHADSGIPETEANGSDSSGSDSPGSESLGSAARALADATAALTRLIGKQVRETVVPEVGDALAHTLREASRGLATVSEDLKRKAEGTDPRRTQSEQTRRDLLEAAARTFAAHGYEGASVGDIAAEAGYTKGAIYAHFGSKENLFLELARERFAPSTRESDTEAADLEDLATRLGALLTPDAADASPLLDLEVLAYGVRHADARAELSPALHGALDRLAERVRAERARDAHADADQAPNERDRDTALGLSAITSIVALYAALEEDPAARTRAVAAGERLIGRLLER